MVSGTLCRRLKSVKPSNAFAYDAPQVPAGNTVFERASGNMIYTMGDAYLDDFIQKGNPKVPVGTIVKVKDLAPGAYHLVMMAMDGAGHHATNRAIDFDITE